MWVEEEKELYLVIVKFELEDLVVGCNYFLENNKLKNNKDIRFDVNELFQILKISENFIDNKIFGLKDNQIDRSIRNVGMSCEIIFDEELFGNFVNVKLLIQKFGGNEQV